MGNTFIRSRSHRAKPLIFTATILNQQRMQSSEAKSPKVSNQDVVKSIQNHILQLPSHRSGLTRPYSPNHTEGMSTYQHIERQFQMLSHLAFEESGERGDFSSLAAMVKNPNVPENLVASEEKLASIFKPLIKDVSLEDWKLLALLVGFHDLGKVDPRWARAELSTRNVHWIAHDCDSAALLRANPELLEGYGLERKEQALITELCRLHSVPGQFFFGEGSVVAYQSIFDSSPRMITLARIHGIIDVMSALNEKFVSPILDSHRELGELFARAAENNTTLETELRNIGLAQLEKDGVAKTAPVGPISWRRLRLLMGKQVTVEDIQLGLRAGAEFIRTFDRVTNEDHTWYGTYIANAFGSGMTKILPEEGAKATTHLVKLIACLGSQMEHAERWVVSALGPAFEVTKGPDQARSILDSLKNAQSIEEGLTLLREGSVLSYRTGGNGVEISTGRRLNQEL